MRTAYDENLSEAVKELDNLTEEMATEATPEAAPDPFKNYSSISLAIAEDGMGEQVICWSDCYGLDTDMIVTLVENKAKSLHIIRKRLEYANVDVGRLLAEFMPIFQVEEKWRKL